jgi:hypothetical protein
MVLREKCVAKGSKLAAHSFFGAVDTSFLSFLFLSLSCAAPRVLWAGIKNCHENDSFITANWPLSLLKLTT